MNFARETNKEPVTHTTSPVYVGGSVIGIKFKNGVIIASDTRVNYGSLCKLMAVEERVQLITNRTVIGYSGEYSDLQETSRILKELVLTDTLNSNMKDYLGPEELASYLASIHGYKRRKMNPYLNSVVAGGINWEGEPVLMNIDPFGTFLTGNYFTTSMGHYFCNAIIAPQYPNNPKELTKEKALDIIKQCFEVLFYRVSQSGNVVKFATLEVDEHDKNKITFDEGKIELKTKWDYSGFKDYSNENFYLTV